MNKIKAIDFYRVSLNSTATGRQKGQVIKLLALFSYNTNVRYGFYKKGRLLHKTSYDLLEESRPATVSEVLSSPFKKQYLEDCKANNELVKPEAMKKIVKTKVVQLPNKVFRKITVAVVLNEDRTLGVGYSVRNPEDVYNKELGDKIAIGRATNQKTNLLSGDREMVVGRGMDKSYILYAVADSIFIQMERGTVLIKGVK